MSARKPGAVLQPPENPAQISSTSVISQNRRVTVAHKIATDDAFAHRLLLRLLKNQTLAERRRRASLVHNEKGFNKPDAKGLTDIAERAKARGYLKNYELAQLRKRNRKGIPRLAKYWQQIEEPVYP